MPHFQCLHGAVGVENGSADVRLRCQGMLGSDIRVSRVEQAPAAAQAVQLRPAASGAAPLRDTVGTWQGRDRVAAPWRRLQADRTLSYPKSITSLSRRPAPPPRAAGAGGDAGATAAAGGRGRRARLQADPTSPYPQVIILPPAAGAGRGAGAAAAAGGRGRRAAALWRVLPGARAGEGHRGGHALAAGGRSGASAAARGRPRALAGAARRGVTPACRAVNHV